VSEEDFPPVEIKGTIGKKVLRTSDEKKGEVVIYPQFLHGRGKSAAQRRGGAK